jgi:hypothetical protein
MASELLLVILVYTIIIGIKIAVTVKFGTRTGYFVTMAFILAYFLFGQANFANKDLFTFYVSAGLFILVFNNPAYSILEDKKVIRIGNRQFIGVGIILVSIIVGIFLTFAIFSLQKAKTASIIGVPSLAIITEKSFASTTFGALGFIENGFFLTLAGLLLYILPSIPLPIFRVDFLNKLWSIIIVSFAFALFHMKAYGLNINSMVFAGGIFFIWGVLYMFGDELIGSTSHYFYNAFVTLGRTLSIG